MVQLTKNAAFENFVAHKSSTAWEAGVQAGSCAASYKQMENALPATSVGILWAGKGTMKAVSLWVEHPRRQSGQAEACWAGKSAQLQGEKGLSCGLHLLLACAGMGQQTWWSCCWMPAARPTWPTASCWRRCTSQPRRAFLMWLSSWCRQMPLIW